MSQFCSISQNSPCRGYIPGVLHTATQGGTQEMQELWLERTPVKLGGSAGTLLLYCSITISTISLPQSQRASFVLTYHAPYGLGIKPVKNQLVSKEQRRYFPSPCVLCKHWLPSGFSGAQIPLHWDYYCCLKLLVCRTVEGMSDLSDF